jgi:hypothetical protein
MSCHAHAIHELDAFVILELQGDLWRFIRLSHRFIELKRPYERTWYTLLALLYGVMERFIKLNLSSYTRTGTILPTYDFS